jgi:hypothetical protein
MEINYFGFGLQVCLMIELNVRFENLLHGLQFSEIATCQECLCQQPSSLVK